LNFALHQALAVVILGHLGAHALAVIGVGLAVAAAHRPVDVRTESRHPGAGATDIGEETFAGLFLTEQAGVALIGGKMKPPHALPTPTASASVGIETSNAIAAANEIAIPLFTVASLNAIINIKNNYRLSWKFCPKKERS
jgi:hypothetical protein